MPEIMCEVAPQFFLQSKAGNLPYGLLSDVTYNPTYKQYWFYIGGEFLFLNAASTNTTMQSISLDTDFCQSFYDLDLPNSLNL
jgi:hypothetical protein